MSENKDCTCRCQYSVNWNYCCIGGRKHCGVPGNRCHLPQGTSTRD